MTVDELEQWAWNLHPCTKFILTIGPDEWGKLQESLCFPEPCLQFELAPGRITVGVQDDMVGMWLSCEGNREHS